MKIQCSILCFASFLFIIHFRYWLDQVTAVANLTNQLRVVAHGNNERFACEINILGSYLQKVTVTIYLLILFLISHYSVPFTPAFEKLNCMTDCLVETLFYSNL